MIKNALVFTKNTLDEYLRNQFGLQETIVVLNHLVDQEGATPLKNQNKMVISLINLEEETTRQYSGRYYTTTDQRFQATCPPLRFNMDVLFTASFEDYEESLKFLTATVTYIQGNGSFNHDTHPRMPQGLQKLNFDIESLSYSETHDLWISMGAKYQPSVIYKARLVTIQADMAQQTGHLVEGTAISLEP